MNTPNLKLVQDKSNEIYGRAHKYLDLIETIGNMSQIKDKDGAELIDFKLEIIRFINKELKEMK